MDRPLVLENCRPYDAPRDAAPVDILVRDGRIAAIGAGVATPGAETLDAGGRTLIPGLIDVHIHGAGGGDTMDGTPESLRTFASTLARLGTTGFLATATVLPDGPNRYLAVAAEHVGRDLGGACLLGLHLEGPFVNPERKGGLPREGLWPPTPAAVRNVLDITHGALRMMTIAPELEGGLAAIETLAANGVIPSFGHSDATYEETRAGIAAGIRHATHLFNAMRGLHHREPGPLVALHEAEHVTVQLISDDVHVNRHVVAWTYRIFGPDRCNCITDGIRVIGLPEGSHHFAGRTYVSSGGTARYGDGTLIGTAIPLLKIVHRFHRFTGCSFATAVDTASRVPARLLGLGDRKGTIAPGYDADLVLLEADGSVHATVVGGRVVHRAN
jgi:N-acetylglucosamine-6-phosphate deacetylase